MKESKFIEEFQVEARLETHRKDILKVLEMRFGPRAVAECGAALKAVNDSARLEDLLLLAVKVKSVKQFLDQMRRA